MLENILEGDGDASGGVQMCYTRGILHMDLRLSCQKTQVLTWRRTQWWSWQYKESVTELAFCKPGDREWTDLEDQKLGEYGDVAYSHRDQLFYALKLDGNELEGWDLKDPSSPKRNEFGNKTWRSLMTGLTYYQRRLRDASARAEYVLESPFGDKRLLVVHRFTNLIDEDDETFETWSFDVYEVDLETKAWVRLKSLGNCVLFLGCNQSFSLSATDFPELRPNSIYFTGDFNHIFCCTKFSFPDSYDMEFPRRQMLCSKVAIWESTTWKIAL
ncbi:hypothetical protein RJ639_027564 [Escallonia herrerae]|uniref:KIB1-4 beta-propeller domain-containing protein n=1 Tax=Escallonia herrerae TaxID=1293975 RepID=A0AA88X3I0_9ASTE|nr:hypothetical protein RJ639_027564 [Escallonia herrerae]